MELNLQYLHSTRTGYGRMGVYIAAELEKLGVTVYDSLLAGGQVYDSEITSHLAGQRAGRSNVVCWLTVAPHARAWWDGQVPTIFTMYETTHMPEGVSDTLYAFDTVIVPSPQNFELFASRHPNVKYVPLGIDPVRWAPIERQAPANEFRFLIGGSGKRKGTDLAYRAFKRLWGKEGSWGDGPIPTLTFKAPTPEQFYGQRINIVSGRLTDDAETALYANAHCYLQPSRGEGFGLQPLQAIAQGLPTILTGAHGHESYSHLGLELSSTLAPAAYFIYGDSGDWWEPNFEELCEYMRDVYDNWDAHAQRAAENATVACETFTWENTAKGLIDAIGPERLGPYVGSEKWVMPPALLYKVVTRRDWHCEVAGYNLAFLKGKEYYESSDIKRILFEAGILDPICLGDGGLTPEQAAMASKYSAKFENCQSCGQPMRGQELDVVA